MRAKATLLIMLMACLGFQKSWAAQATVRVGDLGIVGDNAVYIALEKGYFKEKGSDVKLVRFASGAQMMAPLASGELDVARGGVSIGLFNALARGFPVKIVAGEGQLIPGNDGSPHMVRSDLKEQIKGLRDLQGRKVAIASPGSPQIYMLGKALEREGSTLKDLDLVYMPFADMGVAFKNKAIDAANTTEPFSTFFADRGLAAILGYTSDFLKEPYMQISVVLYNKDWAQKNPEAAREFMAAYLKASRDFYGFITGGETRLEVIDILAKHTNVKDKRLYERMAVTFHDPNGSLIRKSLDDQQDWYFRHGFVTQKVRLDEFIDDSYRKYALEQIGVHPCKRCLVK